MDGGNQEIFEGGTPLPSYYYMLVHKCDVLHDEFIKKYFDLAYRKVSMLCEWPDHEKYSVSKRLIKEILFRL